MSQTTDPCKENYVYVKTKQVKYTIMEMPGSTISETIICKIVILHSFPYLLQFRCLVNLKVFFFSKFHLGCAPV